MAHGARAMEPYTCIVTQDASMDEEIRTRIASATRAFYHLRRRIFDSKDISIPTEITVFRAVLLPSLLYGSESWVLYRKQIRKLEKFQQRQLRRIFGIQWSDFIANKEILDKAETLPIATLIPRNELR